MHVLTKGEVRHQSATRKHLLDAERHITKTLKAENKQLRAQLSGKCSNCKNKCECRVH